METHINQSDIGTFQTLHPDAKGRITLGKLAKGVSSFHVTQQENGKILLEPYVEIPQHEQWLFNNKATMAGVLRGIKDAAEGRVHDLGSFVQYAEDDVK